MSVSLTAELSTDPTFNTLCHTGHKGWELKCSGKYYESELVIPPPPTLPTKKTACHKIKNSLMTHPITKFTLYKSDMVAPSLMLKNMSTSFHELLFHKKAFQSNVNFSPLRQYELLNEKF